MINDGERLIPVARIPHPGSPGKFIHVTTAWRWFTNGIKGVKLETTLVGGRRYTSDQALMRFRERLDARDRGDDPTTIVRTERQRLAASEAAAAKLIEMGA